MTDTEKRPTILCVGRLYCDLIFTDLQRLPSLGTEVYAEGFGLHAGGGAYIAAAHFALLGHHAALASFLPPAPFHDLVVTEIERAGVDISLSRPSPRHQDPQITVAMVAQGDRAFLTRKSGPPFPTLCAADIMRIGAGHIHIGELATLCECPWLVAAAREAGATISLDCGWDETLDADQIARLIASVDVFLPNEAEADYLRTIGLTDPFAPLTVTKQGAKGAMAVCADTTLTMPSAPAQVVDTTGAGDAFNAGFISAWLGGRGLADCLRAGNAMGARAIECRGGFRADHTPTHAAQSARLAC